MTYYEELGVAEAASVEEIRHAYRRVVRLLHPDQCSDEETRRLADLQMKRLNGILAVLGDGGRRAKYDASLLDLAILHKKVGVSRKFARQSALACLLVLLIAVTMAVWPRKQDTPK